jgi:hypothetical protein
VLKWDKYKGNYHLSSKISPISRPYAIFYHDSFNCVTNRIPMCVCVCARVKFKTICILYSDLLLDTTDAVPAIEESFSIKVPAAL